jgi:hypothetical protein
MATSSDQVDKRRHINAHRGIFSPLSNPPYGIVVAAPLYVHKVSQLSVLLQFVFLSFKGGAQDNTQFFSAF